MKLFGRTSGYYLFWTGFVYFWVGMYLAFTHSGIVHYATMTWLLVLSIPLWCPPVARHFNMETIMFDWFNKDKSPSNVVPFPEQKSSPYLPPPAPKAKEPETYYTFGITDDNRMTFTMGYTKLTMNRAGVSQLITQLEFFRDQLDKGQDGND